MIKIPKCSTVAPVIVPILEGKGVQVVQVEEVLVLPVAAEDPIQVPLLAEVPVKWLPHPRTHSREKVTIISVLLVLKTATVNPESVSVHWPPVLAEALPISSIIKIIVNNKIGRT